jgi:hypothetical protein
VGLCEAIVGVNACLQQLRIAQPDELDDGQWEWPTPLLQLRVLFLGFLQDGNIGVGGKTAP